MRIERKNDLSLRLLEIFGTMMRCQTTVEAAEELGISQPAVSAGIKQLEKQLGIALFARINRRLQPTQEAREIFIEVEPVFTLLRSFAGRVRDIKRGDAGRLRIMATPPLGHGVVPIALKRFLQDRDKVSISYDVRRLEHVVEAVEFGTVDIGFVLALESHPAVEVRVVGRTDMVCLVPVDHPLAAFEVVTPGDLARSDFIGIESGSHIGQQILRAFESAHVAYAPKIEVRYCNTAAVLVASGLGVALVDAFTARSFDSATLLRKHFAPAISLASAIVTRSVFPSSHLAVEFIEELRPLLR